MIKFSTMIAIHSSFCPSAKYYFSYATNLKGLFIYTPEYLFILNGFLALNFKLCSCF